MEKGRNLVVDIGSSCEHHGAAMTLEQLVPTLEVCQQLKAAGFPRDTALVWCQPSWGVIEKGLPYVDTQGNIYRSKDDDRLCAAPTAGELEEWLMTKGVAIYLDKKGETYYAYYYGGQPDSYTALTLPDALAEVAMGVLEVAG